MNCQQARKVMADSIGHGGPFAVSRAERVAVSRHYAECPGCRRHVNDMAAQAEARLGPRDPVEAFLDGVALLHMVIEDVKDAEA